MYSLKEYLTRLIEQYIPKPKFQKRHLLDKKCVEVMNYKEECEGIIIIKALYSCFDDTYILAEFSVTEDGYELKLTSMTENYNVIIPVEESFEVVS